MSWVLKYVICIHILVECVFLTLHVRTAASAAALKHVFLRVGPLLGSVSCYK